MIKKYYPCVASFVQSWRWDLCSHTHTPIDFGFGRASFWSSVLRAPNSNKQLIYFHVILSCFCCCSFRCCFQFVVVVVVVLCGVSCVIFSILMCIGTRRWSFAPSPWSTLCVHTARCSHPYDSHTKLSYRVCVFLLFSVVHCVAFFKLDCFVALNRALRFPATTFHQYNRRHYFVSLRLLVCFFLRAKWNCFCRISIQFGGHPHAIESHAVFFFLSRIAFIALRSEWSYLGATCFRELQHCDRVSVINFGPKSYLMLVTMTHRPHETIANAQCRKYFAYCAASFCAACGSVMALKSTDSKISVVHGIFITFMVN